MSFCVVSDVRAIVDTDITDSEIDVLIDECGALINAKIGSAIDPLILRAINRTWVAYRCMMKDPHSESIGEYRGDRTEVLKLMRQDVDEWLKMAEGGFAFVYGYAEIRE